MRAARDRALRGGRHSVAYLVTTLVVFVFDQASKAMIRTSIDPGGERIELLPFLDLRHVHNRGVAFGLLSNHPQLVGVGTVVVAMLLFAMLSRMPDTDRMTVVGVAGIAGGAVGNLADRVRQGYVTDFINVPHWPTFNVADIAITCGVVFVIWRQWLRAVEEPGAAQR